MDYTLVVGVDAYHLRQLMLTWPTWMKHKPSLRNHPMIVFRDLMDTSDQDVRAVVDHPNLTIYSWPMGATYDLRSDPSAPIDKWNDPQRYKMLAGFVHIPAMMVRTPYWLKVDCDCLAASKDDWVDPSWFIDNPAMVAHAWTFTKPPDQMMKLDEWAEKGGTKAQIKWAVPPLNLVPIPGHSRVGHKRVISWCGFFNTAFTRVCSKLANDTCGMYKLPVQSQDGYHFYCATRMGLPVKRVSMKQAGWQQWSSWGNVSKYAKEIMDAVPPT